MSKNKSTRMIICILEIIALVILDQVAKVWAVVRLENKPSIIIIDGAFELYYLPNGNTGAAFGMLQGHQWLFMFIAIIISLALLFIIYCMPLNKRYNLIIITMTFIIAGGIGNMIDRIRLNYVIDFIYFSLINFPIFNVADMYVSVGTTILVILLLFYYKEADVNLIERNLKETLGIKSKGIKNSGN